MVIKQAREVLRIEAEGILDLMERIGHEFEAAVNMIIKAKGRVIFTGMGKSGLVGRKISATFNSTGTSSLFLHPAEAIHGDLGMVTPEDVILAISNSGQTMEINRLLPILRDMGAKIIVFTGRMDSPMADHSDLVIDVGVEREACPLGLAPTASTTAALAMGDALAVALLNRRRFSKQDFKKFHPGGNLGQRLSIRLREVMLTDEHIPKVPINTSALAAVEEINAKKIGATLVIGDDQKVVGIICDGDLRRALLRGKTVYEMNVEEIMTPSPKTVDEDLTTGEALALMELHQITHLVSVDEKGRPKGMVHLHDLLGREGFRTNGITNGTERSGR
ncbi:MAG: KpsF/GutQ family sugar-phosphate isomerase [Desulfatiglandaceae bacterium]